MKSLASTMSVNEYSQFTDKGYFTVRRTDRFWSGNFTDQTIEQDLMRLFKSSGGMTRGRGITDSTLTKWINGFPQCISVCESLEKFANIHTTPPEQHKDLRLSSQTRDHKDFETLLQWLKAHSPFTFSYQTSVVVISTGMVADSSVNCGLAYDVGSSVAARINDKIFSELKLKPNYTVKTISGGTNTVKISGKSVAVSPTLLFSRIACVLKNSSDMKSFLAYELAPQPPSLFHDGLMRKTNKNVQLLKSKVEPQSQFSQNSMFVMDGGYFQHAFIWPSRCHI